MLCLRGNHRKSSKTKFLNNPKKELIKNLPFPKFCVYEFHLRIDFYVIFLILCIVIISIREVVFVIVTVDLQDKKDSLVHKRGSGNVPHKRSGNVPHRRSGNVPHWRSGKMPHRRSRNMPHRRSENMPHRRSGNMPHRGSRYVPHRRSGNMPHRNQLKHQCS
jgi:hypothetical protein